VADAARPLPHATFDARRRGVLAFTCAVHLLALFLWTQERRTLPVRPPPRVVTILLHADRGQATRPPTAAAMLPLPMPATPAVPAVPALAPQPGPVHRRKDEEDEEAQLQRPREPGTAHALANAPASAPVTAPSTPDTAASTPNPIDTAQPVGAAAGAASTQSGFSVGLAKHQAGRIDRELRKGKSGVPAEADTPSARFQRGLESAYIDRTLTWQSDTYTSPDGVVIYRFRQGNRFRCRRAGGVGMPLAGMPGTGSITAGGASAAGATDCPKGVVWNQDP
jgi:hypothetical protein